MTMNSQLPRASLTSSPAVALHLLARQSVTPLSRPAFVRLFVKQSVLLVKEWVLLREPFRHHSYPARPTRLKPILGK